MITRTFAEEETPTSEVTEETTPEETDGVDLSNVIELADEDGNGIPDVIEQYYNENIKDQWMFGISLGALLGLLTSIVSSVYMNHKNNLANISLKETQGTNTNLLNEAKNAIAEYSDKIKEYRSVIEELASHNAETTAKYEALQKETMGKLSQTISALEQTQDMKKAIETALKCIREIANSSSNVKEGIGLKVNEIIDGVK